MSFLYKHIAVTHATSLHLNANVAETRFWYSSFYCVECGAGATNLHCGHLVHKHASTDIALILVEMSRTRTSLRILKSYCFFFSSRRRHTRLQGDWSSDVCSSD